MKVFKKTINIFMAIFVMFLLSSYLEVKADAFPSGKVVTECIYDDAGLYTFTESINTDSGAKQAIINRSPYPLVSSDSSLQSSTVDIYYRGFDHTGGLPYRCPLQLSRYSYDAKTSDGTIPELYVKFNTEFIDEEYITDKYCKWFCWAKNTDVQAVADEQSTHKLVSENFLVTDFSGANHTYYYQHVQQECDVSDACLRSREKKAKEGGEEDSSCASFDSCIKEQASTQREYVIVYVFDNLTLMNKDDKTTVVNGDFFADGSPDEVIFINDPSPQTMMGSDGKAATFFHSGAVNFKVSSSKSTETPNRYIYVEDAEVASDTYREQICDKIPETAKVLRTIISYVKIIIPTLLVILVGLDITKIVIAGNPEEELPKKRKSIIARLITAISVFFLPTIISVILNAFFITGDDNTKEIQAIDCLFTDAQTFEIDEVKEVI